MMYQFEYILLDQSDHPLKALSSGEWFGLSKKPIERDSFTFGGVESKASGYFVTNDCIGCGSCLSDCPQTCIELNGKAVIRQENCLHCGNCAEVCPVGAVIRR